MLYLFSDRKLSIGSLRPSFQKTPNPTKKIKKKNKVSSWVPSEKSVVQIQLQLLWEVQSISAF